MPRGARPRDHPDEEFKVIDTPKSTDADPLPRSAHRDGSWGMALLHGMGVRHQHVYGGTVDPVEVAHRRRRNRAARHARRITRRRS